MSGWDDDEDVLDEMLFDDEHTAAATAVAPVNTTTVKATTLMDSSNNYGFDGLLLMMEDDSFSQKKEKEEEIIVSPSPAPLMVPLSSPPPYKPDIAENNNNSHSHSNSKSDRIGTIMRNEQHEKMMDTKIHPITTQEENEEANNNDDDDDNDSNAWDFEEEEFWNDDSLDVDIDPLFTETHPPPMTTTATTASASGNVPYSSSIRHDGTTNNNPPASFSSVTKNHVNVVLGSNEQNHNNNNNNNTNNPFLQNDNDDDDGGTLLLPQYNEQNVVVSTKNNEKTRIDNTTVGIESDYDATKGNDTGGRADGNGSGDGWSDDDDLFEHDDEEEEVELQKETTTITTVADDTCTTIMSSTISPLRPLPPPPPPPPPPLLLPAVPPPPAVPTTTMAGTLPISTSYFSPVANRTRSKTITTPGVQPPPPPPKPQHHHHHHHQQQQHHHPPPPPPHHHHQVVTLNPSQQRIYQMLSNYITNLTKDDYLSRLHYKLHLYQSRQSSSSSSSSSHNKNTTKTSTSAAAELRHYYTIRPKLRKYTLGVELDRMSYRLILENGKCTCDKDVIRSYFGVKEDGARQQQRRGDGHGGEEEEEEEEATVEELLIRSANQSLLADALVALTGSEEDVVLMDSRCHHDDFFDDDDDDDELEEEKKKLMGLILSGPTLCMSSVAESCQFTVDLQCGKVEALCDLAISVPFHGDVSDIYNLLDDDDHHLGEQIIGDGRIILARARVSVRFRPGGEGGNDNDEPTVQYTIPSVKALLPSNSHVLRQVAIALAHDQDDPFFQEEQQQRADVGDATDIRDLFLLNQHLLSDSGLLAVSDHLERLRGAAEAKSTGFRSALRQLDGVTNVSGKLQFLKGTAKATRGQGSGSGSGFLGLGLSLPSAEEIEAAEREALSAVSTREDKATFRFPRPDEVNKGGIRFPRPDEVNKGGLRFPRPDDVNERYSRPHDDHIARPPPPPPPPPGRPPQTEQNVARPKPIIGGIFMSGLSRLAAAATQPTGQEWGEEGGTGLTPPSSPKVNRVVQAPTNDFPTLYRKEESFKSNFQSTPPGLGGIRGSATTQLAGPPTHLSTHQPDDQGVEFPINDKANGDTIDDTDEDDGGWSDDEFDFEEPVNNISNEKEEVTTKLPPSSTSHAEKEEQGMNQSSNVPSEAKVDLQQSAQANTTKMFSERLSTALQEKIERENMEMIQTGRLKRWTPLREDPILRQKLMEVMVNTFRD